MIAIIDANYIIKQHIPLENISKAYIPSSVIKEIKDKVSYNYLEFAKFKIDIRDPSSEYILKVEETIKNKHFGISSVDIDVVALTLQISDEISGSWIDHQNINFIEEITCLTEDNGIKAALSIFGLSFDYSFTANTFKLRCYACYTIYDEHLDFCKKCGYSTLSRVTVSEKNGKINLHLKSNFVPKDKIIKGPDGTIFKCADQKEYIRYQEKLKRMEKVKSESLNENFFN